MPPDVLQWLRDAISELRDDLKEFRNEYKRDVDENRENQKEIFQRLNALEKASHQQPCTDFKTHQDDHKKRDERWWGGIIKPAIGVLVGWMLAKFGIK